MTPLPDTRSTRHLRGRIDWDAQPLDLVTPNVLFRVYGCARNTVRDAAWARGKRWPLPPPGHAGARTRWQALVSAWGHARAVEWLEAHCVPERLDAYRAEILATDPAAPVPPVALSAVAPRAPRPRLAVKVLSGPLTDDEIAGLKQLPMGHDAQRPKTRGQCADGPRPCPWAMCKYHLAIEVTADRVRLNYGTDDLDTLAETCALDVADRRVGRNAVADVLGVTPQRLDQIVMAALEKAANGVSDADAR